MMPIIEEAYVRANAKLPTGWKLNIERKEYSPTIPCISISRIDDPAIEIPLSVDMAALYAGTAGEPNGARADHIADAIINNILTIVLEAFNNIVKIKRYSYTPYPKGEKIGPFTPIPDPDEHRERVLLTTLTEQLEFTSDIPWYYNDIDSTLPEGWKVDRTFDNMSCPTQFALHASSGKYAGSKVTIETKSVIYPTGDELVKMSDESRRDYYIRLALAAIEKLSPPEGF